MKNKAQGKRIDRPTGSKAAEYDRFQRRAHTTYKNRKRIKQKIV
jgi:hypothetical protein